jgi:head-tail adaptor
MRAGSLDQRVRVEVKQTSVDEAGGIEETWVPYITLWAGVTRPRLADGEGLAAGVLRVASIYEVRFRYFAGIAAMSPASHRLIWNDHILDIIDRPNDVDSMGRELRVMVQEGLTNG